MAINHSMFILYESQTKWYASEFQQSYDEFYSHHFCHLDEEFMNTIDSP